MIIKTEKIWYLRDSSYKIFQRVSISTTLNQDWWAKRFFFVMVLVLVLVSDEAHNWFWFCSWWKNQFESVLLISKLSRRRVRWSTKNKLNENWEGTFILVVLAYVLMWVMLWQNWREKSWMLNENSITGMLQSPRADSDQKRIYSFTIN